MVVSGFQVGGSLVFFLKRLGWKKSEASVFVSTIFFPGVAECFCVFQILPEI